MNVLPALSTTNLDASSGPARATSELIAIVWAPEEQRTEAIAKQLGAEVFHVHYLKYKTPIIAPFKYPLQVLRTWQILLQHRPKYAYVTNPPVFATMSAYLCSFLTGTKIVMDTHPPATFQSKWAWTLPLQRWMSRRVYANVSDQQRFKRMFEGWGSSPVFVFERPPKSAPSAPLSNTEPLKGDFNVAVVNTFAEDEPLDCVLEAARLLPDVHFYITGDLAKADKAVIDSAPKNCTFTGYLLGNNYWTLLRKAQSVMALTTWQNSLIMAGQDGITVNKPTLISKQETTAEYFTKGVVLVENTGTSIVDGIKEARRREQELVKETYQFLDQRQQQWEASFRQFEKYLGL